MSNVKVVWDGSSDEWMRIFKTSPEIREGLEKIIKQAESKNLAALNSVAHDQFKPEHGYKGRVVVGDRSMLAKLTAQSKGARIVGSAHGLPSWEL